MALSWQQRQELLWPVMQLAGSQYAKTSVRAAIDATDDWIEANQASFNSALPQPLRSALSVSQKAWLFMLVAGKRFNG